MFQLFLSDISTVLTVWYFLLLNLFRFVDGVPAIRIIVILFQTFYIRLQYFKIFS
jgi:hypothetical protein